MPELLAGWSKQKIALRAGYGMTGYLARKAASTGSLDPLYVRALVLRKGRLTAGIFLADVLLISSRRAKRLRIRLARALRTSPECVNVAGTHTHSGPLVDTAPFDFSATPPNAERKRFQKQLENVFLKAATEAARRAQAVSLAVSRVLIRNVASDRNRSRFSRKQPFLLLQFLGPKGNAVLGVYGCHPTVLGAANHLFSGDLHGLVARQLERGVDVALIANGAAANISTRFTRRSQTRRELKRLAHSVLRQIAKARLRPVNDPTLAAGTCSVKLPTRNLLVAASSSRRSLRRGRLAVVAEEAETVKKRLENLRDFAGRSITAPVSLLRIGPVTLASLPFEIFSSTGRFLWGKARITPLCYANGYWGYMPAPPAARDDYEVLSSPFSFPADKRLRRAILAFARSLSG